MNSSDSFFAISDRYNFESITLVDNERILKCFRGDCYLNTFTYRVFRNFNDPSLPSNDVIIDKKTWRDNYTVSNQSKWANIAVGDLNAV